MAPEFPGEFPGWTIWRSDAGHWYATAHETSMAQIRDGCTATVDADTEPVLRRRVKEQIEMRARTEVLDEVPA